MNSSSRYAFVVIFGVAAGSGHLVRMTRLQNRCNFDIDILIKLDTPSDFYKAKLINPSVKLFDKENFNNTPYQLVIWDELGDIFSLHKNAINILIDPINIDRSNRINERDIRAFSLNYENNNYRRLPAEIIHFLFEDQRRVCLLLQGGGDDHQTLERLIPIFKNDFCVLVALNSNCRHIAKVQQLLKNCGGSLLENVPVVKIAGAADLIVSSGGNTLFEILRYQQRIILFSEEEKEHRTFKFLMQSEKFLGLARTIKEVENIMNYSLRDKTQKLVSEENFNDFWK